MKKLERNETNSLETLQKLGRKYGVQVTDMAKRGIQAIGILGGVRRQDQQPSKEHYRDAQGSNAPVPDLCREILSPCFRSPEPRKRTQ